MKIAELRKMHALVEAKYEVRRQAFGVLLKKENELRAEIKRLDKQAEEARKRSDPDMQTIGADVIWKSWVGNAKVSLNNKLSLVLAEKEQHVRQVKQAYGKVLATEALIKELSLQGRKSSHEAMLTSAIETTLYKLR
ncbi:hypothetical protein [uncultured Roseobacter sp.]|uniref:hypothetical protein n=1 Tax=uncultured Roseobacter sp. TaxID=114847 RepID=UPI002609B15F|nr:hypothetical protein [uncultured Roseobacter sp.]